jgi:DNA-binding transcriptional LysR family regulator
MGELPTEPALVARRIATLPVSLYAAPAYLKRRGMPAQPAELMQHDALHLLMRSGEAMHWLLSCDEQRWEGLPPARATANSPELLTRLALAGTGIAAVADHLASPLVQRGDLVPVLPQWALPAPAAWAVYPGRRLMPARTRVFLDTLEAEFSSQACKKVEAQYTAERKARASAGKRVTADDAA